MAQSHRNQQDRSRVKETTDDKNHIQKQLEKERDKKMAFSIWPEKD